MISQIKAARRKKLHSPRYARKHRRAALKRLASVKFTKQVKK